MRLDVRPTSYHVLFAGSGEQGGSDGPLLGRAVRGGSGEVHGVYRGAGSQEYGALAAPRCVDEQQSRL